jgi:hypothetical protein
MFPAVVSGRFFCVPGLSLGILGNISSVAARFTTAAAAAILDAFKWPIPTMQVKELIVFRLLGSGGDFGSVYNFSFAFLGSDL